MFKKILVCTDLSDVSRNLAECAGQLKSLGAQEVVLAHILYVANTPDLDKLMAEEARPQLLKEKAILEAAGLAVTTEMVLGKPAYALEGLAEKHGVSLVVIGSHGRGMVASMILGSVSEKFLQLSRRPVLLTRTKAVRGEKLCLLECDRIFRHILFPTDFSEASEVAFSCLLTIASKLHCAVTLLHVRKSGYDSLAGLEKIDQARLLRLQDSLTHAGAGEISLVLEVGETGDAIVSTASKHECSLILMGTHGKGLLQEAVMGSVAHDVARKAEAPILFSSTVHCPCL